MLFSDKKYPYILRLTVMRKELFFMVSLLCMTIAIIACYVTPRKYEARTTISIEQNVITDLVKGIAISPSMQTKIKNLTVLLTSRNMLTRVLKAMDRDLGFRNESDLETYIKDLQQRVEVSLNERQGLIAIDFKDQDRVFARDFVNTMARIYIEDNTSTKREESTEASKFLADQIQIYKKRLDAADEEINKYESEKGLILSVDDAGIRSQISEAEKQVEELTLRRNELQGKWEILAPSHASGASGHKGKGSGSAEAELKRLLSIYTEKNPKVIRARAALNGNRNNADPEAPHEAVNREGVTESQSARLLKLQMDAIDTMLQHENKVIEDNRALVQELPRVKADLAELTSKRAQEAEIYNQLMTRYSQSEISKQMELSDKSTTFRIIDPAVIPEFAASPNRPVFILAGIFLGVAAGFLIVYLADQLDHSIRSTQDLKAVDLPIFAVIPMITNENDTHLREKRDRLVLTVAGSYFILVLATLTVESLKLTSWVQTLLHSTLHNL